MRRPATENRFLARTWGQGERGGVGVSEGEPEGGGAGVLRPALAQLNTPRARPTPPNKTHLFPLGQAQQHDARGHVANLSLVGAEHGVGWRPLKRQHLFHLHALFVNHPHLRGGVDTAARGRRVLVGGWGGVKRQRRRAPRTTPQPPPKHTRPHPPTHPHPPPKHSRPHPPTHPPT